MVLKAWYKMDGDANDSSGNGYDGTLTESPSWLSGWDNRIVVTIDYTKIDATLTYFPVLIKLSSSSGTNSADVTRVFDEVGANSLKIAVTDSTGTSELYVEIEDWDDTNEEAYLWVSKTGWTVSSTVNTVMYLYYDNDHADNTAYVGTVASATGANVWDSDYVQVLHMETSLGDSSGSSNGATLIYGDIETADAGTTTTIIYESAPNYRLSYTSDYYNGWTCEITSGTGIGQTRTVTDYVVNSSMNDKEIHLSSAVTGLASGDSYILYTDGVDPSHVDGDVGRAVDLNGTDQWIDNNNLSSGDYAGSAFSVEVFMTPDTVSGTQYLLTENGPFSLSLVNDNLRWSIYADSGWVSFIGTADLTATSSYVAGTYDGTDMETWVNAAYDAGDATQSGNLAGNGFGAIGRSNNGGAYGGVASHYDGDISEIRVSKVARTQAWRKATNYSGKDDLVTFGSEEGWIGGIINQAIGLNGIGDYMYFNSHASNFVTPTMTITGWIKADSFDGYRGLFYIYEGATTDYLIVRCNGTGLELIIEDDNVSKVNMDTVALDTGIWIHVAFVQDGSGWKFYYNGVEATFTGTNSAFCSDHLTPTNVWIGRSSWVERYWEGKIDDFRFYNHALTTKEVKELSMAKVGHWKFSMEDKYGDCSGYGNHASVAGGAPVWTDSTEYGVGALTCDGDDYISATNELYNQKNDEQEWSVTAWVNIVDDTTNQTLLNFNNGLDLIHGTTNRLLLYLNGGANDYYHYDDGGGPYLDGLGWKQVAYCFRHSDLTRKIYVNGVDVTGVGPELGPPSGMPATITMLSGVEGSVTDIQIFARLLSQTEVQQLFTERAALDAGGNLWV